MSDLVMTTSVDTAMYFLRVITFDFATNGIRLSIFRENQSNMS